MEPLDTSLSTRDASISLLYTRYRRQVLAYLIHLVRDPVVAEDLYQETFIKALRSWEQHDPNASAIGWIYRIAANTAYDYMRRVRRIHFTNLDYHQPSHDESLGVWRDTSEAVQDALAQLPTEYRLPLVLYERNGYTTQEIAQTLQCSEQALRVRLSRARTRFREAYK